MKESNSSPRREQPCVQKESAHKDTAYLRNSQCPSVVTTNAYTVNNAIRKLIKAHTNVEGELAAKKVELMNETTEETEEIINS